MTYYKVLSQSEYIAIENPTEATYGTASDGKFYWDHNSTLLLLSFVRNHFDDLSHPVRRKAVWDEISNEMNCNSVQVSAKCCWQKYKSLIRTFNQAKDDRDKTRRFQFYEQMAELMALKPIPQTISAPQVIEMDMEENAEIDGATVKPKTAKNKVMRQNALFKQSIEAKATYYKEKRRYIFNKDKREEKKMTQQLLLEEKKVKIMEQKVELEKRKLDILTESLRLKLSEISDK